MVSTFTSIAADTVDSLVQARFHRPVAAHETPTPSTTEPPTSQPVPGAPAAWPNWWLATMTGRASRVTAPVNSPTTVDQPECGTSLFRLTNRALAMPYQVHRATAPKAAARPATFRPIGWSPPWAAAGRLTISSPAVTSTTGTAS